MKVSASLVTAASLCCAHLVFAEAIRFPADSGIVDVTKAPYHAVGDGKTDCTAALQKAMNDHPAQRAIIYLPNGDYVISDTINWPAGNGSGNSFKRTTLQGESEAGTVIRLTDRAPGFGHVTKPKAMAYTGPKPAQRFGNEIRNLTFNAGRGNPGAAGIQFNASNQGSMRNVTVCTGDAGAIGIDLKFTDEIGPCLLRDITVRGFDVGVWATHGVNSITFERLTLEGQKQIGIRNSDQTLSIRGFKSKNAVPALENLKGAGLITLVDAELTGGGRGGTAITNEAALFARNITTTGYQAAIENRNGLSPSPDGARVGEWVSHPILSLFPSPAKSLNLPVKETPEPEWDALGQWIAPTGIDVDSQDKARNDASAIQTAIDSGKSTVYLPRGTYKIEGDIILRGAVKRLIGCGARIQGSGRIVIADGSASAVEIERIEISYAKIPIVHDSKRTLILSGMVTWEYHGERGGDAFLDDIVGGPFFFKKQNVWMRQINPEPMGLHISNEGGNLWILGLKTERGGVLVETKNGKTEILGGHNYSTTGPKTTPAFTVENGALSMTMGETNFNKSPYIALVQEARGADRVTLWKGDAPGHLNGSMFPLFVGYVGPGPQTTPVSRKSPPPSMPAPAAK